MTRPPIVLASTSAYRRALLERLGLAFECMAPEVDEAPLPGESPRDLVQRLARAKAGAAVTTHPGALIIGSDQVSVLDGVALGKPGTRDAALGLLADASGRRVEFLTALCLLNAATGRAQLEIVPFSVIFRTLSRARIEAYVDREQPLDCAGSFKSEGLGVALFERMEGDDPSALIGLPLIALTGMLAREGVDVLLGER